MKPSSLAFRAVVLSIALLTPLAFAKGSSNNNKQPSCAERCDEVSKACKDMCDKNAKAPEASRQCSKACKDGVKKCEDACAKKKPPSAPPG